MKKNNIKFLVQPGLVPSMNDNDTHMISYDKLVKLYHLNPAHCIEVEKEKIAYWDKVIIKPDFYGNYNLAEQVSNHIKKVHKETKYATEQNITSDYNNLPFIDKLVLVFKGFKL